MKTKKVVIAMAIFGGALFMASAATQYNLDADHTAKIEKKVRKLIKNG